jgi:hypothetical protein
VDRCVVQSIKGLANIGNAASQLYPQRHLLEVQYRGRRSALSQKGAAGAVCAGRLSCTHVVRGAINIALHVVLPAVPSAYSDDKAADGPGPMVSSSRAMLPGLRPWWRSLRKLRRDGRVQQTM